MTAVRLHSATPKYLAGYAEPEERLLSTGGGLGDANVFERAVIVPVCREEPSFVDGFLPALRAAAGRTLVIIVVNARDDAPPETHQKNDHLLGVLSGLGDQEATVLSLAPRIVLVPNDNVSLLLVDRASAGSRLPAKQGVGLARRIGMDIALSLYASGAVTSPWLHTTDADVALPVEYFEATAEPAALGHSALLYPFKHVSSDEESLDRATELYEISLRYYVLGLTWAGSPYAFHSIGSTLAIDANSYAMVRGFPKRLAGEDFYLLDKLAKVAPILRLQTSAISIASRRSDRVPFGTGPAVQRLEAERAQGGELQLYHPRCFACLRVFLAEVAACAATRSSAAFALRELSDPERKIVAEYLEREGFAAELERALKETHEPLRLLRRLHTWFDALRTLRLIHQIRDQLEPSLPWMDAFAQAQFSPISGVQAPTSIALASLLSRFSAREREFSASIGPTLST